MAWDRLPDQVADKITATWSRLPGLVRHPFGFAWRAVYSPARSYRADSEPGPEVVPGVSELIARGYTPVEQLTGALFIGPLWPEQHRASEPETRPYWLDGLAPEGKLWLLKSPWPGLNTKDAVGVLWLHAERDRPHVAGQEDLTSRVRAALALSAEEAKSVLARHHPG